jgi:ankyrin repeat protein
VDKKLTKLNVVLLHMCTVVCSCAESGNLDGIKKYIEKGLDVNKRDLYKNTALHRASCMGYVAIVK